MSTQNCPQMTPFLDYVLMYNNSSCEILKWFVQPLHPDLEGTFVVLWKVVDTLIDIFFGLWRLQISVRVVMFLCLLRLRTAFLTLKLHFPPGYGGICKSENRSLILKFLSSRIIVTGSLTYYFVFFSVWKQLSNILSSLMVFVAEGLFHYQLLTMIWL